MNFRLDDKLNLPRSLIVLLAVVFLVWTAGAHALPAYEEPSASSLLVDAHGITQSSSDGSSPTDDAPLQRFEAEYSRLKLTSCALVQLAFDGPRLRLLSYPGLPQAPPSKR
ncbi:hypothetical protein [Marinobacter changyiensis]|uniref:hypothetical protein n=1 Tax=Marinobacter changyiensis TaxID=2604091 RepID=UPI0012646497|nr:hypothetical protein [Marinobacter changyiensis]